MKQFTRRQFIASLGGLALTQVLPACSLLPKKPISVAAHVWAGYEPMFLASREGWLDSNQVILVETTSATESIQKLTAGKVLAAALTLDEVLKVRATGFPLSIVMVLDISAGADMLIVRPWIKKLADLKGQRIGFEKNTVGELLLNDILQTAKLKKQDVKLVELTVNNQLLFWNSNQMDAVVTYEPVASQLLAQNGIKLFDTKQIPNTIVDVLAINSEMLDFTHSSAIRHLISANFRVVDHIKRNPIDAAYRMAAHLGLPVADVLPAFKGLFLPDAAHNYRLMTGPSPELLTSARRLSNSMYTNKLLKHNDSLNALVNADFLPIDLS